MDAEPVDHDLVAAVREAPTPEARAALLGVDYAALVSAGKRLYVGSLIICTTAAFVVMIANLFDAAYGEPQRDDPDLLATVTGAGIVVGLTFVGLILAQLSGAALTKVVGARRAGAAALGAYSVLGLLALFAAAMIAGSGPLASGVVVGAAMSPLAQVAGMLALRSAFTRNDPNLVTIVEVQRAEPEWLTLLGGSVRWLLAAFAIVVVASVAAVLIFMATPWLLVPLLALSLVTDLAALAAGRRGNRVAWLAIQLISATAVVVLAIVVSA